MHVEKRLMLSALLIAQALFASSTVAQSIDQFYKGKYTLTNLGTVPGLPNNYGPVAFKIDDSQTLLIGGKAETSSAAIYQIALVRNAQGDITGFSGTATKFANAPGELANAGLSGGLAYGPNNVLFYTSYNDNRCAQIKPGSTSPDKFIDVTQLGVASSTCGVGFVPSGFGGAGRIKFTSVTKGPWFDGTVTANATGTFDISAVTQQADLDDNGPEGFVYVKKGQPLFAADSVLIAEYFNERIVTYEVNANGDPIKNTLRVLASIGTSGPFGLAFDPIKGDLIVSGHDTNEVFKIQGFFPARCPVDNNSNGVGDACESGTCGLCGAGMTMMMPLAILAMWVSRRRWSAVGDRR